MPHDPPHKSSSTRKRRHRIDAAYLDDETFLLATALLREIRALNPGIPRRTACRQAITLAVFGSLTLSRSALGSVGQKAERGDVLSTGAAPAMSAGMAGLPDTTGSH